MRSGLNACELEIDLFCRGLRVPADVSLEGARGISRTRAGLGSGLEIILPAVMAHMYDACRRHWLPIGAAPNIEVSLVVNPDDAAMLVELGAGFYAYEAFRRVVKIAAGPVFRHRMRPFPEARPVPAR